MAMEEQIKAMEASGDVAGLEKAKEDAELSFEGSIVGLAEQAIARLNAKAEQAVTTTPAQVAQVESMGGSTAELESRTRDVSAQIEQVNADTVAQIAEVQGQSSPAVERSPVPPLSEKKVDVPKEQIAPDPELELAKQKQERIEALEVEMSSVLDALVSTLPDRMNQVINTEAYKKLLALHERRKAEEKSLFETYDKYTRGKDDSHRRVHFQIDQADDIPQYVSDLKFNNAPSDVIKRFETYFQEYRKPEIKAQEDLRPVVDEKLNKPRWDFEKTIDEKSAEVYGKDYNAKDNFARNYYTAYNQKMNEADVKLPRPLNINTHFGTRYQFAKAA